MLKEIVCVVLVESCEGQATRADLCCNFRAAVCAITTAWPLAIPFISYTCMGIALWKILAMSLLCLAAAASGFEGGGKLSRPGFVKERFRVLSNRIKNTLENSILLNIVAE